MLRIGLTGGIGSGKSTVAQMFIDRGIPVIDADQVAREVVEPGQPALRRLAEAFGEDILNEDGSLKRSELARRAFVDRSHTEILNAITHPAIEDTVGERFAAFAEADTPAVIYDMPLLVDKNLHLEMGMVIVVDVELETRVKRLTESRGLDGDDARRRIASQVDDATRLAAADLVIDNNRSLEDLIPQVEKAVEEINRRVAAA
ncbi:Dephospho-CoA kinase [Corynebacterium occultum]|uniref:Dephospho-CoA kinase n=1 Tax=Corynebacterium occultum TaxID=2675219 RepID=A0A6B8W3Y5_9CORY|nr:dephospho-CoA kinase [Corynebacterium occultum]QGU07231.1 Dephospho-CoA kinase [Corynebacterium occultum]